MVGFVVEIRGCRKYKVPRTLDFYILKHLFAVHLGESSVHHGNRHSLAPVALFVKPDAAQCLDLCLSLTVGNVKHRIPRVESVTVFLSSFHLCRDTVGRCPYPCGRNHAWQSPDALYEICVSAVHEHGVVPFARTDNPQSLSADLPDVLVAHGQVGGVDGNPEPVAPFYCLVRQKLPWLVDGISASALVLECNAEGMALAAGKLDSRRRACCGCPDDN